MGVRINAIFRWKVKNFKRNRIPYQQCFDCFRGGLHEIPWREVTHFNTALECREYDIRERERERVFVSLFCGSCAIESKVNADVKILNDKHPYLIAMWKALQDGWIPPEEISKEQYKYIKEHKDEDMALSGFVGFGCSFGGKWFGGLAANKRGDNYCRRANKSVLKDMGGLQNATFLCLDYKDVEIPQGAIVYADPPYDKTTGYSLGDFDSNEFWDYARKLSETNIVLVSEEKAPDDFVSIWSKEQRRTIDNVNSNTFVRTENLFVHKRYKNIF